MSKDTASFGFSDIPAAEKAGRVRSVFESVAPRYDLMNDLMSGGLHRYWKDRFVSDAAPRNREAVLDLAGGTGDIAFRMARRAPAAAIMVSDINAAMLEEGRKRATARGLDGLSWMTADAEALPFDDGRFDLVTMSFGIRNCTHIHRVLAEAHRVLKPGGRFFCLEFAPLEIPGLDQLYDRFSFQVIPRLGGLIAGDRDSYQYLVESIRRFPRPDRFATMFGEAGFARARWRPLSAGVVNIHQGRRV